MSSDRTDPKSESDAWREHELSQLHYFRSLSLRQKMEAVQGMADVVRHFQQMRREGAFHPGVHRPDMAESEGVSMQSSIDP